MIVTGIARDPSSGLRFVAVMTASRWRRNPAVVQPWVQVRSALLLIQATSGGGAVAPVRVYIRMFHSTKLARSVGKSLISTDIVSGLGGGTSGLAVEQEIKVSASTRRGARNAAS